MNVDKNDKFSLSLFFLYFLCFLKCGWGSGTNGVKVVTYGDPCVATRHLPFTIEGALPAPCKEEIKPTPLQYKILSDKDVMPPRYTKYSITVEAPCSQPQPDDLQDNLRGKVYTYNTHVPPPMPSDFRNTASGKTYNFAVDVPPADCNCEETKPAPRLKGLRSRVDTVLVPACEVTPPVSRCNC